jgi:hypothetical protein
VLRIQHMPERPDFEEPEFTEGTLTRRGRTIATIAATGVTGAVGSLLGGNEFGVATGLGVGGIVGSALLGGASLGRAVAFAKERDHLRSRRESLRASLETAVGIGTTGATIGYALGGDINSIIIGAAFGAAAGAWVCYVAANDLRKKYLPGMR